MNIDLNLPAPKVAEQLIKEFHISEGAKETSIFYEDAVSHSIKCVEAMLMVCPEEITEWSGKYEQDLKKTNPDHTKLTEVLEILKRK